MEKRIYNCKERPQFKPDNMTRVEEDEIYQHIEH